MKYPFIVLALLISTSLFSQEEWGNVKNNTLTMKELPPIWPGCKGSVAQKDKCFDEKLIEHIIKNFKYPSEEYKKNNQDRVVVNFRINTKGNVEIKSVTGGNKGLQEAAKATILKIPQLKPGMMGGKPRAINMSVPFTF